MRILKHRSTCGSGYPKQATHSAMHSATDSDFLFTSVQGQVWDAEHENYPNFNFQGHFKVKLNVEGRGTEYRPEITSACVPKWSKETANLPRPITQPWALTWNLTFKVKVKVKGWGTGYRPEITSARLRKWSQMIASLPWQLIQLRPLALHLTFEVKLRVKGRDTGYRPEITPACVPKWS